MIMIFDSITNNM